MKTIYKTSIFFLTIVILYGCGQDMDRMERKFKNGDSEKKAKVIKELTNLLKDDNYQDKDSVLKTLGKLGHPGAVRELIDYYNKIDTYDYSTQILIITSLGKIGGSQALEFIIDLVRDGVYDIDLEQAVKSALVDIGNESVLPLIAQLNDYQSRGIATDIIVEIGEDAVFPLISYIESCDKDCPNKSTVIFIMGRIGDPRFVNLLLSDLKDPHSSTRASSAYSLGKIGDTVAVEPLISVMMENDPKLTRGAIIALGDLGDARAVQPILKILKKGDFSHEGYQAIIVLGEIGDERAVTPLINALRYCTKDDVINRISTSLGQIGDARAIDPLLNKLNWGYCSVETKENIITVLVEFGGQHVITGLVEKLKDRELAIISVKALEKLEWKPQTTNDIIHVAVAKRKRTMLLSQWDKTKKVLLSDMTSRDPIVVEYALYTFISLGRSEVIPNLINILNTKGTETTAEAYLNCGNKKLSDAATTWARRNGYTVMTFEGNPDVSWGSW